MFVSDPTSDENQLEEDMRQLEIDTACTDAGPGDDQVVETSAPLKAVMVPGHPDFLMSYAALPGMKAHRDTGAGSFYIQALVDQIHRYKTDLEFEHILKRVTKQVREKLETECDPKYLQLPFHLSTMEQLVYWK